MGLESSLLGEDGNEADLWDEGTADLVGKVAPVREGSFVGLKGVEVGE